MLIIKAISDASKKTFVYRGRSERLEHWAFLCLTALVGLAIGLIESYFGVVMQPPFNWAILFVATWLIAANVALLARRMHDHNLSAFLLFFPLMCLSIWAFGYDQATDTENPLISSETAVRVATFGRWTSISSLIVFASLLVRPGNKGVNKFGDPA